MRCLTISLALLLAAARVAPAQHIRTLPLDQLEDRARRDSCDFTALYELAIGHLAREHYATADSVLDLVIALNPGFADAHYARGIVRNRDGDFWKALRQRGGDTAVTAEQLRRAASTRRAFLIDPFVNVSLLGTQLRRGDFQHGRSIPLAAIMAGDYGSAYYWIDRDYEQYVQRRSSYDSFPPVLLLLHGIGAARTTQYRKAVVDFEALLRLSQAHDRGDTTWVVPFTSNELRYMLGILHQRMREHTIAIQLYQGVIANDLGQYMAHVKLAQIYEAEELWRDGARERQAAIDLNPDDHTILYALGRDLAKTDRLTEAETMLRQAITRQPRFPDAYYALGLVLAQSGKADEARRRLNEFIALAPGRESAEIAEARQRLASLGTP